MRLDEIIAFLRSEKERYDAAVNNPQTFIRPEPPRDQQEEADLVRHLRNQQVAFGLVIASLENLK